MEKLYRQYKNTCILQKFYNVLDVQHELVLRLYHFVWCSKVLTVEWVYFLQQNFHSGSSGMMYICLVFILSSHCTRGIGKCPFLFAKISFLKLMKIYSQYGKIQESRFFTVKFSINVQLHFNKVVATNCCLKRNFPLLGMW